MAIIKPNNNTLSAVTALPAAITTGKVLQVATMTRAKTSNFETTSTSAVVLDDGVGDVELAITPQYSNSNIVGFCSFPGVTVYPHQGSCQIEVFKAGSVLRVIDSHYGYHSANTHGGHDNLTFHFIENNVGTTSAVTYDVRFKVHNSSWTAKAFDSHVSGSPISTITLMEVAG